MLLPYLLHYHSYLLRRLGSIGIKIVITLNLRYWSQRGLALHRVVCSIGTAMGNFQYTPVCSGENFTPMRIPLAREGARPDNATRGKPVARIEIMPQTSGWKIKAEIPFPPQHFWFVFPIAAQIRKVAIPLSYLRRSKLPKLASSTAKWLCDCEPNGSTLQQPVLFQITATVLDWFFFFFNPKLVVHETARF